MCDQFEPIRFIAEEIEVRYREGQSLSKTPEPPDGFLWNEEEFVVLAMLSAWTDFERRGRMKRNMKPHNLRAAARRGSWGVGRFFFRVRTNDNRIFDIYYDRAPENASDRKGHWFLWREMVEI
jgi:hypothetical protein